MVHPNAPEPQTPYEKGMAKKLAYAFESGAFWLAVEYNKKEESRNITDKGEKMDKAVWLIERGQLCVGFGQQKGKLSEKGIIWVGFTSPEALQFETKGLADTFIHKNSLTDVEAREHLFVSQTQDAVQPKEKK
jgi:hypothetical protein